MKKKKLMKVFLIILFLNIVIGHLYFNTKYYQAIKEGYYGRVSMIFENLDDLGNNQTAEVYRFFWDRSFHHPILVTVQINENQATLNLQIVAHPGSTIHSPGKLITNKDVLLTKEQLRKLRDITHKNSILKWVAPKYFTGLFDIGLDGAGWTIECERDRKHYIDYQWSPQSGSVRNIGMYLLELSQLKLDSNEIY